jgi:predicted GTPase
MKISKEKKEKISEQILALLYSKSPKALFTVDIAREMARDEEFIKKILLDLKSKNFVNLVNKNPKGKTYSRRQRWLLTDSTYSIYKGYQ